MTKMQSNAMATRQTMGTVKANRAVMMDPSSSREEKNTLPVAAVRAEDFVRKMTVIPWTMAAVPPPAISASVHFRNGEISITIEAVAMMPAMIAAGDAIRSKM